MYTVKTICAIIEGRFQQTGADTTIVQLAYDSRKIQGGETTLFFALPTANGNSHAYILDAYKRGVRNFVVAAEVDVAALPVANILVVQNVLKAFQALAIHHRQQFVLPVIGITGSNGKTVVKEW